MIFISTGKKTENDLTLQVGNDFKEKFKLPKDCLKKIFS